MMPLSLPSGENDGLRILVRPIFLKVGAVVFGLGVTWATLTAAVADTVRQPEFARHTVHEDSLKVEILHEMQEIRAEVEAVRLQNVQFRTFICRQRPQDFGC